MFNTSSKTIWTVAAATVVLAVALATTTFWILLSEQAATAGLFTLNFNFNSSIPTGISQSELLQDIQRRASRILDVAAIKTADATDDSKNALSSAAASLLQIEEYVPLNCSFGVVRFCVQFTHSRSCSSSRSTILSFVLGEIRDLPSPLRDAIQARVQDLSSLPHSLDSLPTAVIGCLIAGSLSFITLLLLSCFVAYGYPTRLAMIIKKIDTRKQMMIHFGVGLVCCVPYVVLVAMQHNVARNIEQLPAWVKIEVGKIFGISVGAMAFAIIFAALSAILSGYIRAQNMIEVPRMRPSTYSLTNVNVPSTNTRRGA